MSFSRWLKPGERLVWCEPQRSGWSPRSEVQLLAGALLAPLVLASNAWAWIHGQGHTALTDRRGLFRQGARVWSFELPERAACEGGRLDLGERLLTPLSPQTRPRRGRVVAQVPYLESLAGFAREGRWLRLTAGARLLESATHGSYAQY